MKHFKRKVFLLFLITGAVLLDSCMPISLVTSTSTPASTNNGACIPPVANLAYPVGIPASLNAKSAEIAPLGGWQLQDSLPESTGAYFPQLVTTTKEVWVLAIAAKKVFRYRTDIREWKSYDTVNNFSVIPRNLFRTRDGTLWGIDSAPFGTDLNQNVPFLSSYNATTDHFEFVTDVDSLLMRGMAISDPAQVAEDKGGILWFFGSVSGGNDVGLYSFDPQIRKAEKRLSLRMGASYVGPVAAPNGNLWFYDGWENRLNTYSPVTDEVQPYSGLPIFQKSEAVINLFFGRNNRLWIDNKGWLDFTNPAKPVWYQIIPSPVFLTDNGWFQSPGDGLPSRYGWDLPLAISQTSNGWLWFTTSHGTIRLDPAEEEWCLFTSGTSPVVEDGNGYLWIVVFDKLYKYNLKP